METAGKKYRRDKGLGMTVIYLGPDLKGIVRKNQVFRYEPKEVIESAKKVNTLAENLFVTLDKVPETRKEIAREGSFLNITYAKIEKAGGKS